MVTGNDTGNDSNEHLKNIIEDMEDMDDDFDKNSLIEKLKKLQNKNTPTVSSSNLSIGVILEELNGINQMFGRKMIIITNKIEVLKTIHKGAFVRPGRIDRMCELQKMTRQDTIDLLHIFYKNDRNKIENMKRSQTKLIKDNVYTPAFITNICKISRSLDDFFVNLRKYINQ